MVVPLRPPLVRDSSVASPGAAFRALQGRPYFAFLDSGPGYGALSRYSILACDPYLVFRSKGLKVELMLGGRWTTHTANPLTVLSGLLQRYAVNPGESGLPFLGGAIGYLGYDLGALLEPVRLQSRPAASTPDSYLCFYDRALVFDHVEQTARIVSTGLPETWQTRRPARAKERADQLEALLQAPAPPLPPPPHVTGELVSNMTYEAYCAAVRKAKEYIVAGDVYQVNLAQRFETPWHGSPAALYTQLRANHPVPFGAFLDFDGFAVLSASPERFLSKRGTTLETRPIKGTRPRGQTPEEDTRLAAALSASEKDRAEHLMIVDLERSDLGRVAETGSVEVANFMAPETFPNVHHLTSTIRAQVRPGKTLEDILRATFPGGSITGAPKIRAMEIIDELEPQRRGLYTGAIGYFSVHGDFDLNIAIRTLLLNNGTASFHVGGGIVYDSDPEAEYQETFDKGQAFFQLLTGRPAPHIIQSPEFTLSPQKGHRGGGEGYGLRGAVAVQGDGIGSSNERV